MTYKLTIHCDERIADDCVEVSGVGRPSIEVRLAVAALGGVCEAALDAGWLRSKKGRAWACPACQVGKKKVRRDMNRSHQVERIHRERPHLTAPVIADVLGVSSEYVRKVARRRGLTVPLARRGRRKGEWSDGRTTRLWNSEKRN